MSDKNQIDKKPIWYIDVYSVNVPKTPKQKMLCKKETYIERMIAQSHSIVPGDEKGLKHKGRRKWAESLRDNLSNKDKKSVLEKSYIWCNTHDKCVKNNNIV